MSQLSPRDIRTKTIDVFVEEAFARGSRQAGSNCVALLLLKWEGGTTQGIIINTRQVAPGQPVIKKPDSGN